jgi:hypothetical protein
VNAQSPRFAPIAVKTIVTHTVTYMLIGLAASNLLDYRTWFAGPELSSMMRPLSDPWVMAGPMFQPVRGLLFALVFYLLRGQLFGRRRGWLTLWILLVVGGILSTFGPTPGSVEGLLYTVFPVSLHLMALPEVLLQSLLLACILCWWVNHPEKRWMNWVMGIAFVVLMAMPALGLLVGGGAGG